MAVNLDQLRKNQLDGLTVGVVPHDGSTKLRLELDDLIQDADVTNLYLLALIELMKPGVWKDPFSWFQIAGIHGKPFEPWDGVTADQVHFPADKGAGSSGNVDPNTGYCSHSSVLFPTWHRAYLAMFEQAIFLKVADIASQYPAGSPYPAAAQRFRIPYWDPFLPRQKTTDIRGNVIYKCGIPIILMIPRVLVKDPQSPNKLTEVGNPLYSFRFPPATTKWDNNLPLQWADGVFPGNGTHNVAKNTIRGIDEKAGASDHLYVIETLDNALNHNTGRGLPLGGKMYRLLHGPVMSYEEMSNTAYNPGPPGSNRPSNFNSMEGWHNDIHVLCGAGRTADNGFYGHMAMNESAGFDPIFWLHHANVDRITAIWQTLHGEQWWVEQLGNGSNFIEPSGIEEKPSSPLVPFRKQLTANGPVWWTSDDLRDWTTLGYNYPQIPTKKGDLAALNAWVNEAYEWTTVNGAPPSFEDVLQEQILHPVQVLPQVIKIDGKHLLPDGDLHIQGLSSQPLQPAVKSANDANGANGAHQVLLASRFTSMPAKKQPITTTTAPTFEQRFGHLGDLVKDRKMIQWNASIRVEKFALNGSFTIFLFLGDFSEDYRSWYHEPNLVGTDSIFANRISSAAAHCQNCEKQRNSKLLDIDTVPLTTGLLTYWKSGEEAKGLKVSNLDPDDVIPFLRQNLHWRVVDSRGRNAPRDQVASLKVQVSSQIVHLPQEISDKPVYEEETVRIEVTDSRPAGLHRGERF